MVGSYLIAITLKPKDLKILIGLVVIECFFGYIEFVLGIKTFFTGIESYAIVEGDTQLLYFRSVYGLSNNSSAFADKLFLAYLLIYWLNLKGMKTLVLKLFLLGGILISFNRTSMLAIVIFHILQYAALYYRSFTQLLSLKLNKRLFYASLAGVLLLLGGLYFAAVNFDIIVEQLTRRTNSVELSGREIIWGKFIAFIRERPLLGNGSFKYTVDYGGIIAHAHNSFLQILATHGLFIFLIHILMIALNLRRTNFIYVMSILAFSITQYGIFWGISLIDIIFILFLLPKQFFSNQSEASLHSSLNDNLSVIQ